MKLRVVNSNVDLEKLFKLLAVVNNISSVAHTIEKRNSIFTKNESIDEITHNYFRRVKLLIIELIDDALGVKTGLSKNLVPFDLTVEQIEEELSKRLNDPGFIRK